jgi:YD repeat-containing protein
MRTVTVTGEDGSVTIYEYDDNENLVEETTTYADGAVQDKTYNGDGSYVLTYTSADGQTSIADYNDHGWVTRQIEPNGNVTVYSYDAAGNRSEETTTYTDGAVADYTFNTDGSYVLTQTDASGATTVVDYNAQGWQTKRVDPDGTVTDFTFYPNGNWSEQKITYTDGAVADYTFNTDGSYVLTQTDASGATTIDDYGVEGWLLSRVHIDSGGSATKDMYDAAGDIISETSPNGSLTTFAYINGGVTTDTYDAGGNHVSTIVTDREGTSTSYQYNSQGEIASERDANGMVTTYNYNTDGEIASSYTHDAAGNLVSETDITEGFTAYTYNAEGHCVSRTHVDLSGAVYNFTYDDAGNLTSRTSPDGTVSIYAYDNAGNLIAEIDPSGAFTTYVYDAIGNVTSKSFTGPNGSVTAYDYDAAGNITFKTMTSMDQSGVTTSDTYNAAGNLVFEKATDTNGDVTSGQYDESGNLIFETFTDANGNVTIHQYDSNGDITFEKDPNGTVTEWQYDTSGMVTFRTVTDSSGAITTFSYTNGNVTSETDPDGSVTAFTYDYMGNLASETRPDGSVTVFHNMTIREGRFGINVKLTDEYDPEANLVFESSPDGYLTTFTYDNQGNLTSENDSNLEVTRWQYGASGNVMSRTVTDTSSTVTTDTYDTHGNITSETYPDGTVTTYTNTYDANGNLTSWTKTDPSGHIATATYTYDAYGNVTAETYPSGTITTYNNTYDANGKLVSRTVTKPGGAVSTDTFDANGKLISETGPGGSLTLFHDYKAGTFADTYDSQGNLISETHPDGTVTTYTYSYGWLTSETDPDGTVAQGLYLYKYDAEGRTVSEKDPDGTVITYTYNADGSLASSIRKDPYGAITTDDYDTSGNLSSETVIDTTGKVSQYNASYNLIYERDPNGTVTTYTYNANGNVESRIHTDPGGAVTTDHYDAAGHLISETDAQGATTTYTYNQWGNLTSSTCTDANGGITIDNYDQFGNIASETEPDGAVDTYAYTPDVRTLGETELLVSRTHTDPNGAVTKDSYGYYGDRISETGPSAAVTVYHYDGEHNMISTASTNPDGTVLTDIYDAKGRKTSNTYEDESGAVTTFTHSFTYDANNNLTSELSTEIGPNGAVASYKYDANGTLISETTGNITSEAGTDGTITSYAYDANGKLAWRVLIDPSGAITTDTYSYTYDTSGNVAFTTLNERTGNSISADTTVDAQGNVLAETASWNPRESSMYLTSSATYTYDANEKVTSLTDVDAAGDTTVYHYDTSGNVTSETYATAAFPGGLTYSTLKTYNYADEATGRLASVITTLPDGEVDTERYIYDAGEHLTSIIDTDAGGSFVYSEHNEYYANGQQATFRKEGADGTVNTKTWNDAGQMLSETATNSDGPIYSHTWDAAGNPMSSILHYEYGTNTEYWTYDANENLTSSTFTATDPSGAVTSVLDNAHSADGSSATCQFQGGTDSNGSHWEYTHVVLSGPDGQNENDLVNTITGSTQSFSFYNEGRPMLQTESGSNNGQLSMDFKIAAYDDSGNKTAGTEIKNYAGFVTSHVENNTYDANHKLRISTSFDTSSSGVNGNTDPVYEGIFDRWGKLVEEQWKEVSPMLERILDAPIIAELVWVVKKLKEKLGDDEIPEIPPAPDISKTTCIYDEEGRLISIQTETYNPEPPDDSTDPVVLNLSGEQVRTTSLTGSTVSFDMKADGQKEETGWITPDEGFLVQDRNGNGTIDSVAEMFSQYTSPTATTGFGALSELDANRDGKIDNKDSAWGKLAVWVDKNSDGISQTDELFTLDQLGITSIDLNRTAKNQNDNGNVILSDSSFTYADSRKGDIVEVLFHYRGATGIDKQNNQGGEVNTSSSSSAGTEMSLNLNQLVQAMASFGTDNGMPTTLHQDLLHSAATLPLVLAPSQPHTVA